MWWKGGKFTGISTYGGRICALRDMGSDLHAILETEPDKLPPDHSPVASRNDQTTSLNDDSLVSRGEAVMYTPQVQNGHLNNRDLVGTAKASLAPSEDQFSQGLRGKVVPLTAAKRRQLAAKQVTIDVMVVYTPKVAKKYLDLETDLIALAIEQANESFVTSGIGDVQLHLVHHQQVDYDEGQRQHFEHLYNAVGGQGPFGKIHRLRDERRADVVALIVDDAPVAGCRRAWPRVPVRPLWWSTTPALR
jgi:hypothetical protein